MTTHPSVEETIHTLNNALERLCKFAPSVTWDVRHIFSSIELSSLHFR